MSDGFSDGLFRGFIVGAMVGALAVAACGCVPDASAQAEHRRHRSVAVDPESYVVTADLNPVNHPEMRLSTGRFRNEAFPTFESELRAMIDADRPSVAKIAPDRVVAYRVGSQWFQAGVEQCIPEGKP